jgi:hypothetical protein
MSLGSAPVGASEVPPGLTRTDPISSPGAFSFRGSNGYMIAIVAEPATADQRDQVAVVVGKERGGSVYEAPARLDEEGIRANLGALGKIAVTWHPNGRVSRATFKCHRYRPRLYFAEGVYRGSVHFLGEDRYTEARVRHVSGRSGWYTHAECIYTTREGFPGPGLLLEAGRSGRSRSAYRYFSAVQNRPHGQVEYLAEMGEREGPLTIRRRAYSFGRARTLSFDRPLDTASVSPPQPFGGAGAYERVARGRPGRWLGDLVVTFPGRPEVPLAGPSFEATAKYGFRETVALRQTRSPGGSGWDRHPGVVGGASGTLAPIVPAALTPSQPED